MRVVGLIKKTSVPGTNLRTEMGLDKEQLKQFLKYYFSVNQFTGSRAEALESHHYFESYWTWDACCRSMGETPEEVKDEEY